MGARKIIMLYEKEPHTSSAFEKLKGYEIIGELNVTDRNQRLEEAWRIVAMSYIEDYFLREFGEIDYSYKNDLSHIPMAMTDWWDETSDTTYHIQVSMDLYACRVYTYANSQLIETIDYDKNIKAMCENELSDLSFDNLVYLTDTMIKRIRSTYLDITYVTHLDGLSKMNIEKMILEKKLIIGQKIELRTDEEGDPIYPPDEIIISVEGVPYDIQNMLPCGHYMVDQKIYLRPITYVK